MTALVENITQTDLLDQVQIVGEREGGLVECYVPISFVCTEDVPVSEEHVEQLAASIIEEGNRADGGTGQLSPVLLGHIEGEDFFRIIDGFHRCSALKAADVDSVYATVRESTWEDVIDLRILTARTHKVVQFARVVEWVSDAWQKSPWAEKISVGQAFALHNTFSTGSRLGVANEASAIKGWVDRKCNQWQIPASIIYSNLSVASVADPELVQDARLSTTGRALSHLTPGHLKVIALGLPNRYDVQRLVADQSKSQNLRIPQTRRLTKLVAGAASIEEAQQIIGGLSGNKPEPEYVKTKSQAADSQRYNLDNLHTDRGGALQPIDAALSQIGACIIEAATTDSIDLTTQNQLRLAKTELLNLGKRIVVIARNIDTVIATKTTTDPDAQPPQPAPTPITRLPIVEHTVTASPDLSSSHSDRDMAVDVISFLTGSGDLPVLSTKREILKAERLIANPPKGAVLQCVEDLREEVRLARADLINNQ